MTELFASGEILTRNPQRRPVDSSLFVGSLGKAMRVLYAFGGDQARLTATEIARVAQLDPSATQRFVFTLTVLGLLEKDERTKQYRLSVRMLDFAYLFLRSDPLVGVARVHLEHLAQESGELVNLAILDRADVIYIHRLQLSSRRELPSFLGGRMPSFITSNGRVMLAALPPAEAREIIETADRTPLTEFSLTDVDALMAKVEEAREQGFAIVDQESEVSVLSIAAPITGGGGRVVAAVNIVVSKRSWTTEAVRARLLPMLLDTAKTIGGALSGVEL